MDETISEEYYPIFDATELENLNWELLKYKQPWKMGKELRLKPEYTNSKKNKMRAFWDVPNLLPFKLKEGGDQAFFNDLDWQNITDEEKLQALKQVESIQARKVSYSKPIAFIYNPNSGTKKNIRPQIEKRLKKEGIAFEFILTNKAFDAVLIAQNCDLALYSAMVAVGGDGTASEVIGGMLSRSDGMKLPCGYIPNGSGGATAYETGVYSFEDAMDTIVARTVIKMTAIESLADHEDASSVPGGLRGFKVHRFSILQVAFNESMAKIVKAAAPHKKYCGFGAYLFAMAKYYCSCSVKKYQEKFEVTIDGEK